MITSYYHDIILSFLCSQKVLSEPHTLTSCGHTFCRYGMHVECLTIFIWLYTESVQVYIIQKFVEPGYEASVLVCMQIHAYDHEFMRCMQLPIARLLMNCL